MSKLTIKQKQSILLYLDYYEGQVNGIWGALSEDATKDLQAASGLTADGDFGDATWQAAIDAVYHKQFKTALPSISDEIEVEEDSDSTWNGGPYFVKAEFKCKCGGKHCNGYPAELDPHLIEVAVLIREHFGVPVIITSGIRCKTHNANVGGVWNSYHMTGKAMDIYVTGRTAKQVLAFVNTLPGIHYAYDIDGTCVHVDVA